MRAMLWTMMSPDGMVRSAFGGRASVHGAAVMAEAAAVRAGFVCIDESDVSRDVFRIRVERRWRLEYRRGIGALARWAISDGDRALHLMDTLNDPTFREASSRLFAWLSAEPALVEVLPDRPEWRLRTGAADYAEWLTSSLELLDLVAND